MLAAHAIDMNSISDRCARVRAIAMSFANAGRFPPPGRTSLQVFQGLLACLLEFNGIRQFFVSPKYNKTHPFIRAVYLVDFYADEGILAHPLNLLSKRADGIKVTVCVSKMNRYDVRLIIVSAG